MSTPRKKPRSPARPYRWGIVALAMSALVLLILVLYLEQAAKVSDPPSPLQRNPYTASDFSDAGPYRTCTAPGSMLGIDVSEHQGEIHWAEVRNAGIEFAIIRLGFRGYSEGKVYPDAMALANLQGARDAGMKIGAYFYSQAVTVAEAKEEAAQALAVLEGMELDLPVVYDWEYVSEEARTADIDSRTLTDCTVAFCEAVAAKGYRPMVYFNQDLAGRMFLLEELTDYDFWLAMYDAEMDFPYRVQMWQYTDSGTVPGISEPVDLNLYLP